LLLALIFVYLAVLLLLQIIPFNYGIAKAKQYI
jgi:hypothetical protein